MEALNLDTLAEAPRTLAFNVISGWDQEELYAESKLGDLTVFIVSYFFVLLNCLAQTFQDVEREKSAVRLKYVS